MRLMKFEVKLEQLKLHEKNCLLNFVFLFDTVAQVWGRSTCVRDGEANHHGDHADDRALSDNHSQDMWCPGGNYPCILTFKINKDLLNPSFHLLEGQHESFGSCSFGKLSTHTFTG